MSSPPRIRRADKLMPEERARQILAAGYCGRLATVGADGYPYCLPLLYVVMEGEIWLHNSRARGHLRANVEHEALMAKYARPDWQRPKGFFPRIGDITLYAMPIERLTGKETKLPPVSERWPAVDRTKSPNARPPG
jgi:nitroimidazol reductase NimA-like FMN-containing flavoprotein (pyridoxamine 5'-phosphate oxidase superfamily)